MEDNTRLVFFAINVGIGFCAIAISYLVLKYMIAKQSPEQPTPGATDE